MNLIVRSNGMLDTVAQLQKVQSLLKHANCYAECPEWMWADGEVKEARIQQVHCAKRIKLLEKDLKKEYDETDSEG